MVIKTSMLPPDIKLDMLINLALSIGKVMLGLWWVALRWFLPRVKMKIGSD